MDIAKRRIIIYYLSLHRRQSKGSGGLGPTNKNFGGDPCFGAKNVFTDVFDITCDIGDFRVHIFCPQTTQELPNKHHEAGLPEQA